MDASKSMIKKPRNSILNDTIRLAHQGDNDAFVDLYRSYSKFVYRRCLRMLRNPFEAEDASQDVFVLVFLKIHTFRGESAFSSWLYRLATNVVLMRFRRNKRYWTPLGSCRQYHTDSSGEIDAPDPRGRGLFDRIDLQAAIDVLPAGYKAALILHDVHGYGHQEIATLFGYSVGNSKSQLHRARRQLRKLLADEPRRASGRTTVLNESLENLRTV